MPGRRASSVISRLTGGENTRARLAGRPAAAARLPWRPQRLCRQRRRVVRERQAEARLLADLDRALPDEPGHGADRLRVELRARVGLELVDRLMRILRLPVDARAGHRLKRVGHVEDAALDRDLGAAEPIRGA